MTDHTDTSFHSLLQELRVIPPPEGFASKAHIRTLEDYESLYRRSVEDPEEFWAAAAGELHWFEPWDKVLEWNEPWAQWFVGGKMNLAYNCLDSPGGARTRRQDRDNLGRRAGRDAHAYLPATATIEVQRFANVLQGTGRQKRRSRRHLHGNGAGAGNCACWPARASAPAHSVIFGGFAANALVDRINDAQCSRGYHARMAAGAAATKCR